LLVVSPVAAARDVPVGDRINIAEGWPDTFPANEPFHIKHGWTSNTARYPPQFPKRGIFEYPRGYDFNLMVNGFSRNEDFILRTVDFSQDPYKAMFSWVHNFPEGMTGEVTFVGYWVAPCQEAISYGWYTGICPSPQMPVIVHTASHVVEFTP